MGFALPQSVVVIGGGTMGSGIAMAFAARGPAVDLVEPSASVREALPARLHEGLARMRVPDIDAAAARIRLYADLEDVPWAECGFVVESAVEDAAVKRALFARLDHLVPPGVPVGTNSSTLPVAELAGDATTVDRMLGFHFLMPAQFVPVVEVIDGPRTDEAVIARAMAVARAIGKRPVRVRRVLEGFLVNRMQAVLMREALALVDAGVASAADVDTAVRFGFGFRYAACGPIVQKEHSGWEISTALYRRVFPTLSADAVPPPSLEAMLAAGRHGMKTGYGFLEWDADRVVRERDRYERALRAALDILEAEGGDDPPLPWRSDST